MHCSRAWLLTIAVATALAPTACGSSSPASCAQGTERCPCFGNSTCNPGLTCASNTCVSLGGASGGGGQAGTVGSGGTGGSSKGGTGGTAGSGGTSAGGTGGATTGGSGGSGTGGSGSCTANTSTDPQNCGSCSHVCKNADPVFDPYCPPNGCCVAGHCGPSYSPCLTQGQVTSCAAYCVSIGEACVPSGCALDGLTWAGWGSTNACNIFYNPPIPISRGACADTITFDASTVAVRCCCTDTH